MLLTCLTFSGVARINWGGGQKSDTGFLRRWWHNSDFIKCNNETWFHEQHWYFVTQCLPQLCHCLPLDRILEVSHYKNMIFSDPVNNSLKHDKNSWIVFTRKLHMILESGIYFDEVNVNRILWFNRPAPKLKDVPISEAKARELYLQCVHMVRIMFQQARLVHADLSEYNML